LKWFGEQVKRNIEELVTARVAAAGEHLHSYIFEKLGVQGSVVPFVASKPGEYPYRWGPELQQSLSTEMSSSPHGVSCTVISDAVDKHLNPGRHFSADAEFGSWWNGWAYDFMTGKIVKVAPAHQVAPRPFMKRGLDESKQAIVKIIAEGVE
jgi:hypothetical protein